MSNNVSVITTHADGSLTEIKGELRRIDFNTAGFSVVCFLGPESKEMATAFPMAYTETTIELKHADDKGVVSIMSRNRQYRLSRLDPAFISLLHTAKVIGESKKANEDNLLANLVLNTNTGENANV